MTETGWYTGDQKPVRVGVYERRSGFDGFIYYSWWNGNQWGINCYWAESAQANNDNPSQFQNLPWRGLTEECK